MAWVVGTNPRPGGFGLFHWNGAGWTSVLGGAIGIAVGPAGNPWVVNSIHQIFSLNSVPVGSPPPPTVPPGGGGNCTQPSWSTNEATGTEALDTTGTWWVDNDAWSGSHGPQSIYVCNQGSWYAVSD